MANTLYDNFFLANEVEDQFNSHLDLMQFCTVDTTLEGVAGMKKVINVYNATDGTEKLTLGQGNSKSIEVGLTQKEYEILLAQNRFDYFDEEAMKDPNAILVGMKHAGTDMFNTVNKDIFAAFKTTSNNLSVSAFNFDAFVDAQAMLNVEGIEQLNSFAFCSNNDMAAIRKALKDSLQYVESFARNGYVGTCGGTNLYIKKDATPGEIIVGTREAVTCFVKKGTEVEVVERNNRSETAANIRKNSIFTRKYYLAALTDETKAIKMSITG